LKIEPIRDEFANPQHPARAVPKNVTAMQPDKKDKAPARSRTGPRTPTLTPDSARTPACPGTTPKKDPPGGPPKRTPPRGPQGPPPRGAPSPGALSSKKGSGALLIKG